MTLRAWFPGKRLCPQHPQPTLSNVPPMALSHSLGPLHQQKLGVGLVCKQTRKTKTKRCVETLKMFYSLVFKLATPSKSGGFLVWCPERIHRRYEALGPGPRSKGDRGMYNGLHVKLFYLCVCLSFQTEETLIFPALIT